MLEAEGEILLVYKGKPRYVLSEYKTTTRDLTPPPLDYWARLTAYQPQAITAADAEVLREDLRGDR